MIHLCDWIRQSNAKDTHAELIKKFSKTSKDIRKTMRNRFYVEFENPETMEANKEALESLKVNGEQVFVDYVRESVKYPPPKKQKLEAPALNKEVKELVKEEDEEAGPNKV